MITENNGRFLIETDHTSYLFLCRSGRISDASLLWGKAVSDGGRDRCHVPVISNQNGCSIIADQKESTVSLDDRCQEASSRGREIWDNP